MQENKTPAKSQAQAVKKKSKWTKDDTELSILALPTTVWYILFCYLPMFGIILAFKDYKITPGANFFTSLFNSDWVAFDNFKYFFGLQDFLPILRKLLLRISFLSGIPCAFLRHQTVCTQLSCKVPVLIRFLIVRKSHDASRKVSVLLCLLHHFCKVARRYNTGSDRRIKIPCYIA